MCCRKAVFFGYGVDQVQLDLGKGDFEGNAGETAAAADVDDAGGAGQLPPGGEAYG